jgi:hypothetical protein
MTQAEYIIGKFGGINAMAAKLGHRNASTVQGWKKRGTIPPKRYMEILGAAQTYEIALTPEDFVHHLKPKAIFEEISSLNAKEVGGEWTNSRTSAKLGRSVK